MATQRDVTHSGLGLHLARFRAYISMHSLPGLLSSGHILRQLLTDYYPLYLSTWCVLMCTADVFGAAALDYGFAGDYDYSLITALVDDRSFVAELDTYDYDYGTPRAVPETAAVTTRTASNLDNNRDRRVWFQQVQPVTLSPRGDKFTQHGSH